MKKVICFLLIVSLSLSLCGCWNNFDLDNLAIVVGVGFDKGTDGQMQVTAEVLSQNSNQAGKGTVTSGGSGGGKSSILYTVEGKTFFDAIRNFIAKSGKRFYWNDVQVVVISSEYAKGGIADILDFFERDQQANLKSDVVVAKGLSAKEVLEAQPDIDQTVSTQIDDAMTQATSFGKNVQTSLFDIFRQLSFLNPCAVVSTIEMDTVKGANSGQNGSGSSSGNSGSGSSSSGNLLLSNMAVQGSAVFKSVKLIGYLSPEATRGFEFAENKIQGTLIIVNNPQQTGKSVSIKLVDAQGKLGAVLESDNSVKLTISVSVRGAVGDQQGGGDPSQFGDMDALTKATQDEIKKEIQEAIDTSQHTLKSDIFGFNELIYDNSSEEWAKIKPDWDRIYSASDISVQVTALIDRTGMITKPLS